MPGPKSDKVWADAVRKAVMAYHEETDEEGLKIKTRNINLLALNLVAMARKGDMQAMKEIGDRLDGKPHVSATVTHDKNVHELSDDELSARIADALTRIDAAAKGANGSAAQSDVPESVH